MKQNKDGDGPSLRSGFRNDSEALYEPQNSAYGSLSPEEIELHKTVERHNMVNRFMARLEGGDREMAEFLLRKLLPAEGKLSLTELEGMLSYVERAVEASRLYQCDYDYDMAERYRKIDDLLNQLNDKKDLREISAYIAPRLLGTSSDQTEIDHVAKFIAKYIVKDESILDKQ